MLASLALLMLVGPPVMAPDGALAAMDEARGQAMANHLARVGGWALGNVAGGAALVAVSPADSAAQAVGVQGVAWGAVNLAIVGAGAAFPMAPSGDPLADERQLGDILLVNLGLDVGYAMAGGALVASSFLGARPRDAVLGHGLGIIVQGAGLFVLDAIVWSGSRQREDHLASRR